jgi:uncharacterized protein involved in outer membrane biogenesis
MTEDARKSAQLTPPRRPSWLWWTAASLGAVVLLTAIALLTIDFGRFKPRIVQALSDALHRDASIEGDLHITLGSTITVEAFGVRLANAPPGDVEPMLSIGRFEVVLDSRSLLGGPPRIERLTLSDVTVDFTRDEGGAHNWQLGRPASAEDLQDADEGPSPFLIDKLSIESLTARIADPALEAPMTFILDSLEHEAGAQRLETAARGTVNGEPFRIAGRLEPRGNIWAGLPVTAEVVANLGDLSVTGNGRIDSLQDLRRPELAVELQGPDIDYAFELLKVPAFTSGPLMLSANLASDDTRTTVDVRGALGEFDTELVGWLDDLAAPRTLDFRFGADGPDAHRIAALFGFSRMPALPFDVAGKVTRNAERAEFDDIVLTVGNTSLNIDGSLATLMPPGGGTLDISVRGDDIAAFRELLALPGVLEGSFDIRATVEQHDSEPARLVAKGRIGEITEDITVRFGAAEDLQGTRVTASIDGPDLRLIGNILGVEPVPAEPFSIDAEAVYEIDTTRIVSASVRVGDRRIAAQGLLDHDFPGSQTALSIEFEFADAAAALTGFGVEGAPPVPASGGFRVRLDDGMARIDDIEAVLGPAEIAGSLSAALASPADRFDIDLTVAADDAADLLGPEQLLRLSASPLDVGLSARRQDTQIVIRDARVALGDAIARAQGTIDGPPDFGATRLSVELDVPNLADIGELASGPLPNLPLRVSGQFEGDTESISGTGMNASLGDSDIALDFRYTRAEELPELQLDLASRSIDLRPFSSAEQESETAADADDDGRLIPDFELPVDLLARGRGKASVHIDELLTSRARYSDVSLIGELSDSAVRIERLALKGKRGELSAGISYLPDNDTYVLDTRIEGERLILAPLEEREDLSVMRPAYKVDADLTSRGTGLRSILAGLDGRILIQTEGGVIPDSSSWLRNLVMGDFIDQIVGAINPLDRRDDSLRIECAVAMLDATDGVISGNPALVVRTDTVNAFIKAKVDLDTEALDLDLNVQQRRGLGLSLSDVINPYTKVTGTLAAPKIVLDQKGAVVQGGAAVATGGLTILAKGLRNRLFAESDPCAAALEAWREAQQQ